MAKTKLKLYTSFVKKKKILGKFFGVVNVIFYSKLLRIPSSGYEKDVSASSLNAILFSLIIVQSVIRFPLIFTLGKN